ncbi:hypothetical protein WDJ51_08410 [Rathayibacter sp. YIM 133350]|uniref:hypothetical protein n=1 Tax=Rathayibacter sp. YIM 133350 TaxID=3131992 RepID=UPI00307D7E96
MARDGFWWWVDAAPFSIGDYAENARAALEQRGWAIDEVDDILDGSLVDDDVARIIKSSTDA